MIAIVNRDIHTVPQTEGFGIIDRNKKSYRKQIETSQVHDGLGLEHGAGLPIRLLCQLLRQDRIPKPSCAPFVRAKEINVCEMTVDNEVMLLISSYY